MLKRVGTSIVGLVLVLGWWTLKDKIFPSGSKSADKIPAKVWGGGGGKITIEAEATEPASVATTFEMGPVGENDHKFLEAWQKIPAGKTSMTVDVPAGASCHLSLLFPDPSVARVGSTLTIRAKLNGESLGEDTMTLEKPLEPGYGMEVELNYEDCATGKPAED